ncbi:hypothetical protein [Mucilaginibacter celer]|nr:hypothetical protein [Mucilaginibacter celer]
MLRHEASSTISIAAIQGEEDPSFLRMTGINIISPSETIAFTYSSA